MSFIIELDKPKTKFAFITVDNTKDTQVTASFGKWTNGSTTVMQ